MDLRVLPSVDEIIADQGLQDILNHYHRPVVVTCIRSEIDEYRRKLKLIPEQLTREEIRQCVVDGVSNRLMVWSRGSLIKVINASGVILHTNLGRAVLAPETADRIKSIAESYTNLEFDLENGTRGSRYSHVEPLLTGLLGCEAALVVNNNAAAVLLALNTLALGKEVIVSRGQLVEIGGSFRIPEIMKLSGANLIEVGTTNKTYSRDYEDAVSDNTALLLAVHTSNYRILGFTYETSLEDLVTLGKRVDMPVMYDLGSGTMIDGGKWGLEPEVTVQECLASGIDIVTFSGDKLLGGPQAGIIAGKRKYVDKMKKNQLLRALRVDKLTIAALEATLSCYLTQSPEDRIPVLKMLGRDPGELKAEASRLAEALNRSKGNHIINIEVVETIDKVGGGAYPLQELPGYAVTITTDHAEKLVDKLRRGNPSVLVRIKEGVIALSVRTLLAGEIELLPALIYRYLEEAAS
ncbi:MAG: L-seryl-tRNA(Sec) selenium transferase [Chitinophagales bacterium]